jgi:predicted ATPase
VRALSSALDLASPIRDAFIASARPPARAAVVEELSGSFIPLPLTSLVGREADIRTLRQWLADPSARLITLIGPGGVGKTRLALELARAAAAGGAMRVECVSLTAIRDPAFVAPAIAEALGLADVAVPDLPKRARVACEGRATLMVLDNFEQVLDAAPLVADLLATATTLRLVVTSRAPLHIRGEREYPVGPLALDAAADAMAPADLARCPAVHLFLDRVRDRQPQFLLTPANASTVAAICRRVDALPLALELAASWMKVLAPEDLRRRLEADVLLSSVVPRDVPGRQQTMNAAVAWSYQLLDANEQRAFRRFGALPGLFPISAAAAVLAGGKPTIIEGDALVATASLIDKSLLVRSETVAPTGPRYYMLEAVRAFASLQLTSADERVDAMEGLVRYCSDEAARAAEGLRGPTQIEWLDRVREDLETYRAALTWLIERGRAAEAADIAYSLRYFWLIRGHAAEGVTWYQRILEQPSLPPLAESRALFGSAGMWWTQGELERVRAGLERVRFLAPQAGDLEIVAQAEHVAGHVEHALGNIDAARGHFARSLELFRTLAIPSGTGNTLSGMAVLALATGDHAEAERLLEEATSVLRHAGPWFLTWALYVRATLAVRRKRPAAALTSLRESLARIRDLHDRFALVYALVPLAAAAVLNGDDAWAARIIGTRHAVTERTGATVADDSVRDLWEHAERHAREHLGADRWAKAYAAGRLASIESLLEEIDRKLG